MQLANRTPLQGLTCLPASLRSAFVGLSGVFLIIGAAVARWCWPVDPSDFQQMAIELRQVQSITGYVIWLGIILMAVSCHGWVVVAQPGPQIGGDVAKPGQKQRSGFLATSPIFKMVDRVATRIFTVRPKHRILLVGVVGLVMALPGCIYRLTYNPWDNTAELMNITLSDAMALQRMYFFTQYLIVGGAVLFFMATYAWMTDRAPVHEG